MCLGSYQASVLTPPEVVVVPGAEAFVANNHFVPGFNARLNARISGVSKNFNDWFLSGIGKIEEPILRSALGYQTLQLDSKDESIMEKLGGYQNAETRLSQIFHLITLQPNGGKGALLIEDGKGGQIGNIFYVRDMDDVRRVVFVSWCRGGWLIAAVPACSSRQSLHRGHRVFSRYNPAIQ